MGYGVWGIGYDSKLVVVRHEGVGVQLLMEYSYLILEGSRSSNVEGCSLPLNTPEQVSTPCIVV